jgi:hypothetical protein
MARMTMLVLIDFAMSAALAAVIFAGSPREALDMREDDP